MAANRRVAGSFQMCKHEGNGYCINEMGVRSLEPFCCNHLQGQAWPIGGIRISKDRPQERSMVSPGTYPVLAA